MNKRQMMNVYYDERAMHSAEIALKQGIEDGSIKLNGDKISGNTYNAKMAIKEYFAARWIAAEKCWKITKDFDFAKNIFENGLVC